MTSSLGGQKLPRGVGLLKLLVSLGLRSEFECEERITQGPASTPYGVDEILDLNDLDAHHFAEGDGDTPLVGSIV